MVLGSVVVSAIATCVGLPIAYVSEAFEYDVLRALNRPLIVHRAQAFFGQQLLPHLQLLQWGFRAGGSTITTKAVMNVVVASVGAMALALCQTLAVKVGDR